MIRVPFCNSWTNVPRRLSRLLPASPTHDLETGPDGPFRQRDLHRRYFPGNSRGPHAIPKIAWGARPVGLVRGATPSLKHHPAWFSPALIE